MTKEDRIIKKELKRLISKIRKLPQYRKWRRKILENSGWTEEDKGIQAHHLEDISDLIREYGIKKVEEAIKCTELWKAKGVALTRGEHFILTKLKRYKYLTSGFILLLEKWLSECKSRPRKRAKKEQEG